MSTITTPPGPSSTAPMTTPKPVAGTIPGERRIAIRGLSWDLYDRLSEAIGEDQYVRLAYDGKDLEILVTGIDHEDCNQLLTLFLPAVTTACGIPSRLAGHTTWKRPALERGIEADQCVYFDPEKLAAVNRPRKAGSRDIADYPNPDLAIEIDISRPQIDRPSIYAALAVPEIWRFDGHEVVIEQLGPDGQYTKAPRSRFMPVRAEDIRRWLVEEDSADDLEWKRRLAEWARGLQ